MSCVSSILSLKRTSDGKIVIYIVSFNMKFSRYMGVPRTFALGTSGDGGIRTLDPLLARQVLSQLSYTPI